MARCELLDGCSFFEEDSGKMAVTVKVLQRTYCLGDNIECARYIAFQELGPGMVPNDLFPNNYEYLEKLLAKQVG